MSPHGGLTPSRTRGGSDRIKDRIGSGSNDYPVAEYGASAISVVVHDLQTFVDAEVSR